VHSAAEWLLRKWGHGAEVERATDAWAGKSIRSDRRWYVTRGGLTMAVFPDAIVHQADFLEVVADKQEQVTCRVSLPPFAVSVRRVSHENVKVWWLGRRAGPTAHWGGLSHAIAAQYCNALTVDEEGERGTAQCCYEFSDGAWRLKANYADLVGYRLPTEFEWNYAVRLGTTTPRFYGDAPELFDEYGHDDRRRTGPTGALCKPNAAGLFDSLVAPGEFCNRRTDAKSGRDQASYHGASSPLAEVPPRSDTASVWNAKLTSKSFGFRLVRTWRPDH
jgi:Sulfatase-modifying factor enzyme 1